MDSTLWFSAAAVIGFLCAVLALVVVWDGWRRSVAEVAILGAALFGISALTTSLGLSPTALGGGPPASALAGLLALPFGTAAAAPLLAPGRSMARAITMRWRVWVLGWTASSAIAAAMLLRVGASPPSSLARGLTIAAVTAAGLLAKRQWLLYRISGRPAALAACLSIVGIACSTLGTLATKPGDPASWLVLTVDALGVFGAGFAALYGYRNHRAIAEVLAPILAREPLAALEVGLSPEVHAFVAALGDKDEITRDHVVRTSALAMRLAIRAGLPVAQVRAVALGALLHDIGKLVIPSEIINKQSGLTDVEYATIRTHAEKGEILLANSVALAPAGPFVRGHHERVDGQGYPDGLVGDEVRLEVALVSVCDAWDAMTHTRQYRKGLSLERALEVMQAGAGSQWRNDAVELLLTEVRANGQADLGLLGHLGRRTDDMELLTETCCSPSAGPGGVSLLVDHVRIPLAGAAEGPRCVTLVAITIDAVADIRQTFGDEAAEQAALTAFAALTAAARADDIVARVGDSEFIHVGEGVDWGPPESLARRVLQAIRSSDDTLLMRAPSVSIGIATTEFGEQRNVGDLLGEARGASTRYPMTGQLLTRSTCTSSTP